MTNNKPLISDSKLKQFIVHNTNWWRRFAVATFVDAIGVSRKMSIDYFIQVNRVDLEQAYLNQPTKKK